MDEVERTETQVRANADALHEIWKRLDKLESAVFTGNGQPPLVARMAAIERAIQTQTWIMRTVLGGVLANLVGLAFLVIRRGV
jgi:hypothetical protein